MQQFNPAGIGKSKHAQGVYQMVNPSKYNGSNPPVYRSSWELDFCRVCDLHPSVVYWCVEPFPIKYPCPIEGKLKNYWPDFLVQFKHTDGSVHTELIEIKPHKLTEANTKSKKDKIIVAINMAKWAAAKEFCDRNNIVFRILTEKELYQGGKK